MMGLLGDGGLLLQKSSLDQRLWKSQASGNLHPRNFPPSPLLSPSPSPSWLDFLSPFPPPIMPLLPPQPLPNPVPHTQWPWERQEGGSPSSHVSSASPLIFNYQGCGSF